MAPSHVHKQMQVEIIPFWRHVIDYHGIASTIALARALKSRINGQSGKQPAG